MMKAEKDRLEAIVGRWLGSVADEAQATAGVSVRDLLMMSVGRVVIAEVQSSGDMVSDGDIIHQYERDTKHIRDWLVGAVIRNDPWLARVNQDGVPLKLAKSGRFEQIVDEANKAMRKLNTRGVAAPTDSEVVHEFGNGYKMVRLDTSAELEAESSMMQHCVGQGAYHGAVEAGATGILSLRDAANKAHVTIEIDLGSGKVVQVKGKQNDIPRADYFEMVAEWLNTQTFEFDCDDHPVGYAVDRAGKLVNISKLEDGDEFDGSLKIDLYADASPSLPENLVVTGSFSVLVPGITPGVGKFDLPKGLVVLGDIALSGLNISQDEAFPGRAVYLDNCVIERLPSRIEQTTTIRGGKVIGDFAKGVVFERPVAISAVSKTGRLLERSTFLNALNLDGESGCSIPDGFKVAGDFKITRSTAVFFDGSVDVGRSLVINDSRIEGDPSRLRVGGTLHVHRSKMRMLPDDTVIGTDLVLSSVEDLRTLPRSVKVGGSIRIDDTRVSSLEGRNEFTDLVLHRTDIEELAAGTVVTGSLRITNSTISRLPRDLVIGGALVVSGCPLKRIPHDAKIGGDIILKGSYVVAIPEGFHVKGNLDISGIGSFLIPKGVTIDGALMAGGSGLEQLPADLSVQSILAPSSSLSSLPKNLTIEGDLDVRKTRLMSVPEGISVGGFADFRYTKIDLVPASAFVGGELRVEDHVVIDIPVAEQRGSYPRFG
ncbi:PcfJ domain-containing protein [Rhizobium sp. BK176]|uniref:PcfJ domain-containing protein n=1 Tax=Rhizobium sp. BK176 TaxID=2587071 RepID=UPI002168ABF6|nr:PcfJ domain-containing protein [Rhizobium sp. BK176]MCS4089675.1 hypothetical protein [Rhizobium sp. BK176]